jgi:hypothetical protein
MSQEFDAQGEAHDALGTAVNSYGQRVLNDPLILGNLVTDLLPDLPRERSLLVTGAEAGVAADMTQHVEEQHIDPDTAVQLVARTLSERRAIDPGASVWVATEYAQALGYQVRPYAEAAHGAPPRTPPAPPPAGSLSEQAVPTTPPAPGQQWQAGQIPPEPPRQPWPSSTLSFERPRGSSSGRKGGLIAGGIVAGLAAVFFIVAAVAGIAPFTKASHKAAAPKPTHTLVRAKPTQSAKPSPSPAPTLAADVTPLIQLLPQDIADPTTECVPIKKPDWTSPGLVSAMSCDDPDVPNGVVEGYQLDNRTNYNTTWQNFNSWSSFDVSTAGSTCPPASNGAQGIAGWNSQEGFPEMQGQVVECWMGTDSSPIYVWTMPTQDAFIIAVGGDGSSFKSMNTWWTSNNSAPAHAPATSAQSK